MNLREPRTCWIGNEEFLFHGFFELDEVIDLSARFDGSCGYRRKVIALVETVDGRVECADPTNVRFLK